MGKVNDVMHHYLEDNERFADLFNAVYFKGAPVLRAEELSEKSEQYTEENVDRKDRRERKERRRDLKKQLRTGESLKILAVENQNLVDYTMPLRCMEYDTMEYQKQIKRLQRKNRKAMQEKTEEFLPAERLCGIHKTDRLFPTYTICLYHGEERERYMEKHEEEEEYNMCQALQEWIEEERSAGVAEGILVGRETGREEGVKVLIESCQELGVSKETTFSKVMQKFSLQRECAEKHMNRYWRH